MTKEENHSPDNVSEERKQYILLKLNSRRNSDR